MRKSENKPYLTEANLGNYIQRKYSTYEIISNKSYFKEYGKRFRPDFIIPKLKLIYEFDGYYHFNCNKTIVNDIARDKFTRNLGFKTLRIPYFIQLDSNTIPLYFGEETIENYFNFPHGFIDESVVLPGRYTTLGAMKFYQILNELDNKNLSIITNQIIKSLMDK